MAFIYADRVLDRSTSTGTGSMVVSGTSPSSWRTFSTVCAVGDTFYYTILDPITGAWETGEGTYSATNTVARTVFRASSTGAVVNFAANAKDVFLTVIGQWFSGGPYLPLAGGTLTGALTGTTATFSGTLTGSGSNWSNPVTVGTVGTVGSVRLQQGDATHPGLVGFHNAAGVRQGYIGGSQPIITYNAEQTGGYHDFYAPTTRVTVGNNRIQVNSPDTLNWLQILSTNTSGYIWPSAAGSALYLGAANNNSVVVLTTTHFSSNTTKTVALGNSTQVWNGLHATANVFYGATSGTITVNPPAVAGTNTITWPAATGTVALTSDITAAAATATQAEMEAATDTTKTVTPGMQKFHPGMAKAWGQVTSAGALLAGYGCTVTRTGVGSYFATISPAMSSASFAVIASVGGGFNMITANPVATTQVNFAVYNITTAALADVPFHFVVFGDQ